MKLTCLRYRRSLSIVTASDRAIPESSGLGKHLATCEECSRELGWFRAAHHDMSGIFSEVEAPSGFADAAWARLAESKRPHRSLAGAIAWSSAACAAVIALVILMPRPESTPNALKSSDSGAIITRATPAEPKTSNKPIVQTNIVHVEKQPPVQHRRIRRSHTRHLFASHRKPKRSNMQIASVVARPAAKPISWDRMAFWYEVHGDYRSAAAAYAQAVREKPTESLVFNAGRTSECAGNVAQAVEYYARVLKQDREKEPHSKQEPQPRRGTWQWYENRDSA